MPPEEYQKAESIDPLPQAVYQRLVIEGHKDMTRAIDAMSIGASMNASTMTGALNNNSEAIKQMARANAMVYKIPIAVTLMATMGILFYFHRIEQWTFIMFCLISIAPWFSDQFMAVKNLIDLRSDKQNGK